MKHISLPTQQRLHELFYYVGGNLIRKKSVKGGTKGNIVGTKDRDGRLRCKVDLISYQLPRLMWMWYYGTDPGVYEVDHIDNNPHNNNIWNLQLLTQQDNLNKAHPQVCGAYLTSSGKWAAYISQNSQRDYLGTYETREEAETAYQLAHTRKMSNYTHWHSPHFAS